MFPQADVSFALFLCGRNLRHRDQCQACFVPGADPEGDCLQAMEQIQSHFRVDVLKGEAGVVPGCHVFKTIFAVFVPAERNLPKYFAPVLMVTLAWCPQMQITPSVCSSSFRAKLWSSPEKNVNPLF